ncbi:MAG: HD domain-containing protein [Clostridia bacterium]|nr:HD domain-containing protein [Clostridia bacterium]
MEPRQFLDALRIAEHLKDATRHSYTSGRRHESVAEHSWRTALMAYFLRDEFPQADMDKVIRMLLIHDLGEAFTGDIPTFLKTGADEEKEDALLHRWVHTLPDPYKTEMLALYAEMNERKTLEARIYKAIDSLEAVIQHNEAPIDTWIPLEYDLNVTYASDKVAFSDYLTRLRALIREDTLEKIRTESTADYSKEEDHD